MEKTAILARTYQQYIDWCQENGKKAYGDGVFFITDAYSLRGRGDFDVVRTGDWFARKDLYEVEAILEQIKKKTRREGRG